MSEPEGPPDETGSGAATHREESPLPAPTDRLSALGTIAAAIAEELSGALEESHSLLRELVSDLDRIAAHARGPIGLSPKEVSAFRTRIADAFLAAGRASRLGGDLRRIAVSGREPTLVDVNTLVESALNIASQRLRKGAAVSVDYAFVPEVRAWPDRLGLAIAQVLVHAAAAIGTRGGLKVQTAYEDDRVVVRVIDTGDSVPVASLVHEIVAAHGGTVEIETAPGMGTQVRILLPVAQVPSALPDR